MKNAPSKSNPPSSQQAGSVPDRQQSREAGQASQEQQDMSNNASGFNATHAKQQGVGSQSSGGQHQADTGSAGAKSASNKGSGQMSPSRDQGHSPPGSSKADESGKRSGNDSSHQAGKKH